LRSYAIRTWILFVTLDFTYNESKVIWNKDSLSDSRFLHKVHDKGTAAEDWEVSGLFTVGLSMMDDSQSLCQVQSRYRIRMS